MFPISVFFSSSRIFLDKDIPPQRRPLWRDLCEHAKEGLEAGPGDQAHPPHHQVSSDRPQPRVRTQRGGGQAAARAVRHILQQSQALHRDTRSCQVFLIETRG